MARKPKNEDPEPASERSPLARNVLTFLAILGILFALWLIWRLKPVVVLVLISVVFATGLAPAVLWVQGIRLPWGWRLPRSASILIVYIVSIIVLLGAISLIVVPVVQEVIQFSANLPEYIDAARDWFTDLQARYPRLPDLPEIIDQAQAQLGAAARYILGPVGAVFGFFGSVLSVITVIVITYFLLATYENIRKGFLSLVPPMHEEKIDRTLSKMAQAMGGWLRGQLLLAGIVGGTTAIAMLLLGVPYPFVIAVVGAIAELVHMAGPLVAAVPAILLMITGPTWKLVLIVIFFIGLSVIEGNIIGPKVMHKSVGLTPLLTIIALLVGVSLLGIVGALLAIPLAAALQVLFSDIVAPALRNLEGRKDGET